ncbi:hypothetical protein DRJ22_03610 [Candidatus Woesearchaeota archaeon]|nr:MAG: hypothetical protein B6U93_00855 [Candidatus Woesearchaeota archaeon ex4484_78]RLE45760.1 MAG: hypothetical protein DRJ22_03610 [Candidatus Woesearchaeota archaeon]
MKKSKIAQQNQGHRRKTPQPQMSGKSEKVREKADRAGKSKEKGKKARKQKQARLKNCREN